MLIELFLLYSQSSRISLDSIWEWIHSSSLALSESLLISWLRTLVGFYFVFNLREMYFYPSFSLVIFSTYLFLQLHRALVASCETRYWTQALCTGKRSFSHWITREVPFPPNFCFYNLLCLPKNWCFQTVVLEKTLERPLDCKEIKPVNLKGNQPWIFFQRTDAEAPRLCPPDVKSWLIGKDPDAGKDWRQKEKRAMVRWHHQFIGHEPGQTLGDGEGQRNLACYGPWGGRPWSWTQTGNSTTATLSVFL